MVDWVVTSELPAPAAAIALVMGVPAPAGAMAVTMMMAAEADRQGVRRRSDGAQKTERENRCEQNFHEIPLSEDASELPAPAAAEALMMVVPAPTGAMAVAAVMVPAMVRISFRRTRGSGHQADSDSRCGDQCFHRIPQCFWVAINVNGDSGNAGLYPKFRAPYSECSH